MSSQYKNSAMTVLPTRTDSKTEYDIGYKKPPADTRFQKGVSGNPSGRPKGAKNKLPHMNEERLKSIILEEAYRNIPVQDRGKNVSIPIAQAVVRSLAVNAAKGNSRAQRLFTEMLSGTETSWKRENDALLETAINFKVEWEREFDRCDRLGIPRPEVLPHPDHVVIDVRAGTVKFAGPMTKEEKAELETWIRRKAEFEEELEFLKEQLPLAKSKSGRDFYVKEIARIEKILNVITSLIPS